MYLRRREVIYLCRMVKGTNQFDFFVIIILEVLTEFIEVEVAVITHSALMA